MVVPLEEVVIHRPYLLPKELMVVMVTLQVEQVVEAEQLHKVLLELVVVQELVELEQRLQLQDHQLLMLVVEVVMGLKVEQLVEQVVVELVEIQV